jgi:cysteine desulfurase/selenocysteine lyase
MSTSEPFGAPPGELSSRPSAVDFAAMASEVARLANQFLSNAPALNASETPATSLAAPGAGALGPELIAPPPSAATSVPGKLSAPRLGPSAASSIGGGGLSGAAAQPPVPGFMHAPPLAASPFPKEADVRPAPTLLAELLGTPTPLELMLSADSRTPGATPYFMDHAGLSVASAERVLPEAPRPALSAVVGTPHAGYSPELVPDLGSSPGIFDANAISRDFPILEERVHGNKRLIWLDNAATTQKPRAVIDRLTYFYEHENSNIHRAAHTLAARATDAYEGARERVRRFLNAPSVKEIVFTRGATEAINLVAQSWGRRNITAGDEIVLSVLEHHANIVPWQQLSAEKGAKIRVAPVDSSGQIILEEYEKLFNSRTRIASFTQVSNALGTITPAREMVEIAHRHGARVLIDGAQTVSHQRVDVQSLDSDFYVFSGHKVFGPTGIGALFGKAEVLEHMPPWQGGGNMIADVTFEKTTYQLPPFRFEAGTGNIADAVGLGAAIDYVMGIGLENIARYEHELLLYASEGLGGIPGLTLIGTAKDKAGVLSFVLDGMRTEDVGAALDKEGIAVRSGHHCAQPILRRFGLEATVRASLAPYNTKQDIDALVAAVTRLQIGRPRGL